MDKVSVTKTQANSNKILKTQEINKNSMFQAKLCFSGKVLFGQVKVNKGLLSGNLLTVDSFCCWFKWLEAVNSQNPRKFFIIVFDFESQRRKSTFNKRN